MPYLGAKPTDVFADQDLNGAEFILDADADTSITADTDDQIDIRIAGADDFQFTANTFTAQSGSTITTPTLGVVNTKDLGAGLHIKTADSGASVDADADELVIEGSAHSGLSILSGATSKGGVLFADSGDADAAQITYDHNTEFLAFNVGGNANPIMFFDDPNQSIIFQSSGGSAGCTIDMGDTIAMYIGSTDAANAGMTRGITINQSDVDNESFALKSDDIAHGITDKAETDTYFSIKKNQAATGAPDLIGLGESVRALVMSGFFTTADTTKSSSGNGAVIVQAALKSGTGVTSPSANANLFLVSDGSNGNCKFIVDTEGELHSDGGAQSAYDEFDDVHLIRAADISRGKGIIDSKFDKFIAYNHEKLAELKLVGREKDGTPNHFINITGMQRLHNGAIWQQYEKHHNLLNAVYELATKSLGKEEADSILEKHDVKILDDTKILN